MNAMTSRNTRPKMVQRGMIHFLASLFHACTWLDRSSSSSSSSSNGLDLKGLDFGGLDFGGLDFDGPPELP